jgi:transposase-like protein
MSKKTSAGPLPKTLLQAVRFFADPENCRRFMVGMRWPDGVTCPRCGSQEVAYLENARVWKCRGKHDAQKFSAKVGTIMEDSPIGLDKWLPAIWLIVNCKNGVSSYEVHRALGVTQKTAWFLLHRIRLAMQDEGGGKLGGAGKTVEADETWIGGKARGMNTGRKGKAKTGAKMGPYAYTGKAIVMGMLERGGRVRTTVIPDVKGKTVRPLIRQHVAKGSELHTDEAGGYNQIDQPVELTDDFVMGSYPLDYEHKVVNHAVEYVRGNVHTNGIENFWSLLKRTIRGTYVSVEPFHLFRYLDEQAFRFNERRATDGWRFMNAVRSIVGKRLTYKNLIGAEMAGAPS